MAFFLFENNSTAKCGMLVCFHRDDDDDDDEHRGGQNNNNKNEHYTKEEEKSFMRFKDSWNVKFLLSARFNNIQQNRFKLKICQLHYIDAAEKTIGILKERANISKCVRCIRWLCAVNTYCNDDNDELQGLNICIWSKIK